MDNSKREHGRNEERFRRRMEEQTEDEQMKIDMKKKKSEERAAIVKLPKLTITKFVGTAIDGFRLWIQFETKTDEADINPVSKLSYLRELLIPKVFPFYL